MWLSLNSAALGLCVAVLVALLLGVLWRYEQAQARRSRIARDLPFMLDLVTLCVDAGLSLPAALQQAAARSLAGPLRDELAAALAEIRAGVPREHALAALAARTRVTSVQRVVAALAQSEALGLDIAPVLRTQADQLRQQRFLRIEQLALQAPVKLLAPLVLCLLPCTFLVIAFPILVRLLAYL